VDFLQKTSSQQNQCCLQPRTSANNYQPGSTFTALPRPWTHWFYGTGIDPSGCGCWLVITLWTKNDGHLNIVSAYRVCNQNPKCLAAKLASTIKVWLLTTAGYTNPDPWKQFLINIAQQIQTWQEKEHKSSCALRSTLTQASQIQAMTLESYFTRMTCMTCIATATCTDKHC